MYRIICMKLSLFLDGANNLLFQVREVRAKLIEDTEFLELLLKTVQFWYEMQSPFARAKVFSDTKEISCLKITN